MQRLALNTALLFLALGPACAQWEMETSNSTADLRGIHSVGNGVAWASGTNGTILRTEDSGYVWQSCSIPPGAEKLDFRGIQGFNANTAIVMSSGKGDLSRLYKTTDGCHTWNLVFTNPDPEGFFDSIYFPREQRTRNDHEGFGLLLGDPVGGELAVFETRNGGYSWNRISGNALKVSEGEFSAFAASNSCISGFGGATFDIAIGGKGGSFLLRLSYKGHYWLNDSSPLERTWQKETVPMAKGTESAGAFSIAQRVQFPSNKPTAGFKDLHLVEVIVGGDYLKPDNSAGTASYHDLHAWHAAQTPPHGYRSSVAYDPATQTWITVGPNGTDISTDDGKNWWPLRPDPTRHEATDADRNWNAISLPFVVGPHGRIGKLNAAALKP